MATNSVITKVTGTDSSSNRIGSTFYGTCTTAAATASKAVTLADSCVFTDSCLVTGATIHVKFTNSNTNATPTLKVGTATAKQIMAYGTTKAGTTSYTSWYAGAVVSFTYDGTYWQMNDYVEGVDISTKMDKVNPTGSGYFSLNRKAGTTIGSYSFAEGYGTQATGSYSHAEGGGAKAIGDGSHAEGAGTQANGIYSHAEGTGSQANGDISHAEGNGTIAAGNYQHVSGTFNITDEDDIYAEIIGNGTYNARSNARTLDWSGNEVLSGTIDATGFGTTLLNLIYPIGSIYMSVNNVNPSTYLKGTTWEEWGTGRVPVGVDTKQTEFEFIEKTGGEKTVTLTAAQSGVPAHTHQTSPMWAASSGSGTHNVVTGYPTTKKSGSYNVNIEANTAQDASQAHNNLQPYITCYMWKRTA